jgi:hypothetical protein
MKYPASIEKPPLKSPDTPGNIRRGYCAAGA